MNFNHTFELSNFEHSIFDPEIAIVEKNKIGHFETPSIGQKSWGLRPNGPNRRMGRFWPTGANGANWS